MKEYDNATLQKVQQLEMMILRDSLQLCAKHNLQMFGIAGTAIGAIRHGGFIPWDDDIDVAILREDYDLFISFAKQEMSDKYIVMNVQTDENYPLMSTRLMLKDTQFREDALKDIHCFLGIFLDIYVFDTLPDEEAQFKKQCHQAFVISKLQILRSIPFPVLPYRGIKAHLIHAVTGLAHGVLKILGISKQKIALKALQIAKKYDDQKDSKRVGFLFDTFPELNIYKREDIFPLREISFNGIQFYLPRNVEKNLLIVYGDYMQLPPQDKRKNHYPYDLNFGRYQDASTEEIAAGKYDIHI